MKKIIITTLVPFCFLLMIGKSNAQWSLTGNAGTTCGTNFVGTTDNACFTIRTFNNEWIRVLSGSNGLTGFNINPPTARVHVKESGEGEVLFILQKEQATRDYMRWQQTTTIKGVIDSAGHIGIGVSAPLDPLHILSDSDGDAIHIEQNSGGKNWQIGVDADSDLNFEDNGTVRVTFETGGEVGIGVSAPLDPLHILTDAGGDAIHLEENSGGEDWQIGVDADGDLNFEDEGTIRITFRDGGNVGIGTTTPIGNLQITDPSASSTLYLTSYRAAATTHAFMGFQAARGSEASPAIVQNNDELFRMMITGHDGNDLSSRAAQIAVHVDGTPGANDMPGRIVFFTTPDGSEFVTERMRINSSGHVLPGATNSYDLGSNSLCWRNIYLNNAATICSDQRLKENIQPNTYGLNEILQLNPVFYTLKPNPQSLDSLGNPIGNPIIQPQETHIGLIAQEVQPIINEIVSVGNGPDQILGVRYSELLPVLIKAIQEQQAIINSNSNARKSLNDELDDVKYELEQIKHSLQQKGYGYNPEKNSTEFSGKIDQLKGIILNQNDPNPFAEKTTISYFIPDNVIKAQLFIYDISGKIVRKINISDKGNGTVNVYASDLSTGMYSYSIVEDGNVLVTKKMVITK